VRAKGKLQSRNISACAPLKHECNLAHVQDRCELGPRSHVCPCDVLASRRCVCLLPQFASCPYHAQWLKMWEQAAVLAHSIPNGAQSSAQMEPESYGGLAHQLFCIRAKWPSALNWRAAPPPAVQLYFSSVCEWTLEHSKVQSG